MLSYPQHIIDILEEFRLKETLQFEKQLQQRLNSLAKKLLEQDKENTKSELNNCKSSSTLSLAHDNNQTLLDIKNTLAVIPFDDHTYNIDDITIDLSQDQDFQQNKVSKTEPNKQQQQQKPLAYIYYKVKGCKSGIYHMDGCGIIRSKQLEKILDHEASKFRFCGQCQIRKDKGRF